MKDTRQISLKGSHVSYTVYSNTAKASHDTPLLMLHGSKGDGKTTYRRLKKHFSQPQQILIADYAGLGNSSLPKNARIETLTSQVSAIIDDFAKIPVDLVGHSLGSITAAATAALYPEKIRKLVLSAPWPNTQDIYLQLIFNTWEKLIIHDKEGANSFALLNFFTPEFLSTFSPDIIKTLLSEEVDPSFVARLNINRFANIEQYLNQIESETCVIGMKGDTLIPTYIVRKVAEQIRHITYKEIHGGHAIQIENPIEWSHIIASFLYDN